MGGEGDGTAVRRGVFLDRDGTINVDTGYTSSADDLEFLPGAVEGLRLLKKAGFCLAVITNQSGVARGYHTEEDVVAFHEEMNRRLTGHSARIDRFYYCPHHVDGEVQRYRRQCGCRKPGDALYRQAIADLNIDPRRSFAIGDKASDVEPAVALGATGVLIGDADPGPASQVGAGGYGRASSLLDAARLLRDRDLGDAAARRSS